MAKNPKGKHTLNTHIGEAEHAWLKVAANREGVSITAVLRQLIKNHMRQEIAQEAIALGLRCSWEGCANLPDASGPWPHFCTPHGNAAEARLQERRKAARVEGRRR